MKEISPEELEKILMSQPVEGEYCDKCKAYRGSDGCAPFETTIGQMETLPVEYQMRYFHLLSCPYFETKDNSEFSHKNF